MSKLFHTKKLCAAITLAAILCVWGYVFFFQQILAKGQVISETLHQVNFEQDKNSRLDSMKALIEDTSGDIEKLNMYFVGTNDIVNFIEMIKREARESGVTLAINNIGQEGRGEGGVSVPEGQEAFYKILKFREVTKGSWQDVFNFFTLLEQLPLALSIEQAGFDTSGQDSEGKTSTDKNGAWSGFVEFSVLGLE